MKKRIVVVALGGNALVKKGEQITIANQMKNVSEAMRHLIGILKDYNVIISHGNGIQVGEILIRVEEALGKAYTLPLEVCVAESEGELGYLIEHALHNVLLENHVHKPVISLLTEVIVDKNDPAFKHPTKPIGPWYNKEQAEKMQENGFNMVYEVKRGYRRVVASPTPKKVENSGIIKKLVRDAIVIAVGGGGIPVIKEGNRMKGVSAVIDKDLASACLAKDIKADLLLILTGVKNVYLNYGTNKEQPLSKLTIKQAQQYLKEGHFPEGSMGPKIQAAINFLKHGGKKVIITSPSCVEKALRGKEGTTIIS